ncbi:MAG: DUF5666 domain-containing protein [Patescibacteria group bacterium]
MKNQKVRNIVILVVVAIAFGAVGYFIPHPISHHKGKKGVASGATSSTTKKGKVASKAKHVVLTYVQGSISNISTSTLTVNGTNIMVTKGTKIYNGVTLENISSLQDGTTVSVIGTHTKKGFIARFIIVT